jgi:hypothetical protein
MEKVEELLVNMLRITQIEEFGIAKGKNINEHEV